MDDQLLTPVPVLKIGRKIGLHRPRVLIEDQQVVIRTRCGLDPTIEGFTETIGFPNCAACMGEAA